ncbi:MAG: sulfite exporter TauE/SafE family protein [Methanomassiliicoccaceae archaeon]|nr:sulfite exporter TauE/SafE family protein [Methanomassiliicoccaceae archaeon]
MDSVLIIGLLVLSLIAGLIGSLFGLGGGIIVVPVLTILYGMDARSAMAISLVAIAAISATSASSHIKNRIANVRIGLRLEVGAAAGAVAGAVIALHVQSWVLALCFSGVLIYSAIYMFVRPERIIPPGDNEENSFTYHDKASGKDVGYEVRNINTGTIGFVAAGVTSALSGVGGGSIKIPVMNVHMHIPMKVAAATSSYVIGITAFSGAAVYLLSGVIDVQTAAFVTIGAFVGSVIGVRILTMIDAGKLRRYFSVLLLFLAGVMLLNVGGII